MLCLGRISRRANLGVGYVLNGFGCMDGFFNKQYTNECGQSFRSLKDSAYDLDGLKVTRSNDIDLRGLVSDGEGELGDHYGGQIPWKLIEPQLEMMDENIKIKLNTAHPTLQLISNYYFTLKGKRMRSMIVILMGEALKHSKRHSTSPSNTNEISEKQVEIAQIVEMIHTASLIHDDVIDQAKMRRNVPSVNALFGDKMAVLSGDFLFARISIALAELGCNEVTKIMSRVLMDLVEGEFTQFNSKDALNFDLYMIKTYQKTASLIANGCRCVAIVESIERKLVEKAALYGKHIGIAFQLIDDVLDYVGSDQKLGKPASNDIRLGLTTAPALFAKDEHSEMTDMIKRNFSHPGDFERARIMVLNSNGIEKTRKLASHHCQLALETILDIEDSPYKQGLIDLTHIILNRDK